MKRKQIHHPGEVVIFHFSRGKATKRGEALKERLNQQWLTICKEPNG